MRAVTCPGRGAARNEVDTSAFTRVFDALWRRWSGTATHSDGEERERSRPAPLRAADLRWTVGTRFATGPRPHSRRGRNSGRIAQLVEQLTLNQRVPGSSPGAPTNRIKHLAPFAPFHRGPVYTSVYSFRSPFELLDRVLRERLIATEVVLVEDVRDILERVAG